MEEKKPNILFISSWFPNKNNPTLGNFVEKHVQAANLFCNASVLHVVFASLENSNRFQFDYKTENNYPVLIVYINNNYKYLPVIASVIRFFQYINAYHKGYKYLKEKHGKPDLIHANVLFPVGIIALMFANVYKIPYVFTEHWTGYMPDDPNKMDVIRKSVSIMAAQKAGMIMPVSDDLMEAMKQHGIEGNYQVVPNVIDTDLFCIDTDVERSEKFRFIHISSLDDAQKNITGILTAIEQLSHFRNDFVLLIIGDGVADKFVDLADKLNILNSFVKFETKKTTKEIADYLKTSDCLLMFSNYESFSVVIAEAMACGLPVIASRAGGLANELTPKHGIIIKVGNVTALSNSMNEMMNNYQQYNKTEIAAFAQKFSYKRVGELFYNIYKKAIHK